MARKKKIEEAHEEVSAHEVHEENETLSGAPRAASEGKASDPALLAPEVKDSAAAAPRTANEGDEGNGTPLEESGELMLPDYHSMTDEELQGIIKDAAEATGIPIQAKECQINKAAALLVNRPTDKVLNKADALQILSLYGIYPSPKQKYMHKFLLDTAEIIWENTTQQQQEEIVKAVDVGGIELHTLLEYLVNSIIETHGSPKVSLTEDHPIPPVLDPLGDEFSKDVFYSCIEAAGGVAPLFLLTVDKIKNSREQAEKIVDAAKATVESLVIRAAVYVSFSEKLRDDARKLQGDTGKAVLEMSEHLVKTMKKYTSEVLNIPRTVEYQTTAKALQTIVEFSKPIQDSPDEVIFASSLAMVPDDVRDLAPFILYEIHQEWDTTKFSGTVLSVGSDVLRHGFDPNGKPIDGKYKEIIEIAKKIFSSPIIQPQKPKTIDYPLDKPNHNLWKMIDYTKNDGQLTIGTANDIPDAVVLVSLKFMDFAENVKITKTLTQFDKRCYIACGAIWVAGNEYTTPTQIYKVMGNTGTPNKKDLQKINDSLTKMRAAILYLDNVYELGKTKYPQYRYDGILLPFDRVSAYINGKFTNSAIHLLGEPPLISFARDRKQITTIKQNVLESPLSMTEDKLRLEDYIIDRISHMKDNAALPRTMLFSTIYQDCEISTDKKQKRTIDKLSRLLAYYQEIDFIKGFEIDEARGKVTLEL